MGIANRFLGPLGVSPSSRPVRVFSAVWVLALAPALACTQGAGTTRDAPVPSSAALLPAGNSGPEPPSKAGGVVIAQLVTRDAKVAILTGAKGKKDLRVIVRSTDGALVADGITLPELAASHPELYEVITAASASAEGRGYLDGTLDLHDIN